MKKGEVVTVMTFGGEFVGKYINEKDGSVHLEDPRLLVNGQQGQIGFAKGICMTGKIDPTVVSINSYIFVTPTSEEFEKAYRQAVSGLML